MAKKDNEKEFEDLSGGASENINEADDSFGLPDISYQPLDRSDEETTEEPAEVPADEPTAESSETFSYTEEETEDETESPFVPDTVTEDETEAAAETEAEAEAEPFMFAQRTDDEEASTESTIFGVDPDQQTEEDTQESEYVPGTYASKYEKQNNNAVVWAVILVVLVLGAGGWWFFIEGPKRDAAEQQAFAEQQAQQQRDAQLEEQRRQEAAEAEAARLAEEEAAAAAAAAEEATPEEGTIQTISSRTGRYYLVIASAIDGDLAMDYAKDLADKGRSISIIAPYGSVKFHRVAVTDVETLGEAESVLNDLRAEFEGAWVMKY